MQAVIGSGGLLWLTGPGKQLCTKHILLLFDFKAAEKILICELLGQLVGVYSNQPF